MLENAIPRTFPPAYWTICEALAAIDDGIGKRRQRQSVGKAGRADRASAIPDLHVGDLVFIHVRALPFEKISSATQSWVNHVGIVVDTAGDEPSIAESTFPFSKRTPLSKFIARSAHGRVAVKRLAAPLGGEQADAIRCESDRRLGIFYDTGFNLDSKRQFCSRFVHEVLRDAAGVSIGDVESFRTLLNRNPDVALGFWRAWFFAGIPWARQTITPASVFDSPSLCTVFDGHVG